MPALHDGVATGHALIDTALGRCGLAWSDCALKAVTLPAADDAGTRAALRKHCPDAAEQPPPWPPFVARAAAAIQALLRGEAADLSEVPIDLERVGAFERKVYEATRRLGPGQTCTYGALARAIGEPDAARAVGAALGRNPWPLVVPCHRVLAAGGQLGGFSAPGGTRTKRRLLAIEAEIAPGVDRLL
jgi:methylated-DNA-[protein]-cysteine S-methyltransferase